MPELRLQHLRQLRGAGRADAIATEGKDPEATVLLAFRLSRIPRALVLGPFQGLGFRV